MCGRTSENLDVSLTGTGGKLAGDIAPDPLEVGRLTNVPILPPMREMREMFLASGLKVGAIAAGPLVPITQITREAGLESRVDQLFQQYRG